MAVSIFIVDPDPLYIDLLRERLQSHQVLVSGSCGIQDALRFLGGIRPDLIVVNPDIEMGSDLLRALQNDWQRTPVIISTPDDQNQGEALQEQFEHVIQRSNSPEAMLRTAVAVLGNALLSADERSASSTLIVDDDPDVLRVFRTILTGYGYRVRSAQTIPEGMDVLDSTSDVALVLLDIVLPGDGGLEFLKKIRTFDSPPTVILVSGVSDEELARETLELGAFDYLLKPVDPHALMIAVIAGLAQASESHREGSR